MPTSWYQAAPVIVQKVVGLGASSVLDIGVGFGKYGVLLREAMDIPYERYDKSVWLLRLDGIEAFPGYRNPIHDYVYNSVRYAPIQECINELGVYDVVLLIDVLEHFPKEHGMRLLNALLEHTSKALIVSTPMDPAPQGEYMGNAYEAHLSHWDPADFAGFKMDLSIIPIQYNHALIVNIYP